MVMLKNMSVNTYQGIKSICLHSVSAINNISSSIQNNIEKYTKNSSILIFIELIWIANIIPKIIHTGLGGALNMITKSTNV